MKSRRSSNTLSISIPEISFVQTIEDISKRLGVVFSSIGTLIADRLPNIRKFSFPTPSFNRRRLATLPIKKYIPLTLLILILLGIGTLIISKLRVGPNNTDQRIQLQGAKASQAINKEFAFPLLDTTGKEVSKLKYFIESAELRDEIIVKGQRAVAINGRTFLIFTVKLTNDFDRAIEVNARDYMRLSVNGNEQELLAADIHNDPAAVQAISTKYTRLGFPISDTDKDIVLIVGEIKGEKQKIPIKF